MNQFFLSLVMLLLIDSIAFACPACAVANPQKDASLMFWVLSAMGIIPLVAALTIGLCIAKVSKNE